MQRRNRRVVTINRKNASFGHKNTSFGYKNTSFGHNPKCNFGLGFCFNLKTQDAPSAQVPSLTLNI